MKILVHNNLLKQINEMDSFWLQRKTMRYIKNFTKHISRNRVRELIIDNVPIWIFKIDKNHNIVFTKANDPNNELNIALLEIIKIC